MDDDNDSDKDVDICKRYFNKMLYSYSMFDGKETGGTVYVYVAL